MVDFAESSLPDLEQILWRGIHLHVGKGLLPENGLAEIFSSFWSCFGFQA